MLDATWATATEIAAAVRSGAVSASALAEKALDRIAAVDPAINAFTDVTAERALAEAGQVDALVAAGIDPGPLAGVPFAVKNLFDIAGLPTRAGSKINRDRFPSTDDAVLIRRMHTAGAVLVGALNMGEYAYDFTGENAHDGPCRNPHDLGRMSGGSSSGCGAATAAGLAPVSLGSDTNGSLRVPAALCGVFSLKPTYGRLPRTGTFSFVDSLDHLGPFARSAADLALAYDALQGHDPWDHGCARRPIEPTSGELDKGVAGLRIGLPTGWIERQAGESMSLAEAAAEHLQAAGATSRRISLDEAEAGRAAAYLITNSESASFHLDRLRTRAADFDPDTRDRFIAGALLPAAWTTRAQRVRAWWLQRALKVFEEVDVILVPATPVSAPEIGQRELALNGKAVPLRPTLGVLAQPFSCIGLPVVTVPIFDPSALPSGLQVVVPPWREARALKIARALERAGLAVAHLPKGIECSAHARPDARSATTSHSC